METNGRDKDVLNLIQGSFPITEDPYAELGAELGMDRAEVLKRTKALIERGVLRKVGVFFEAKKLGAKSTLCAVDVPAAKLEDAARVISSYPGVTHNYLREGTPNLWFTVIASSSEEINEIIEEIGEKAAVGPIHNLPVKNRYKLRLELKVR